MKPMGPTTTLTTTTSTFTAEMQTSWPSPSFLCFAYIGVDTPELGLVRTQAEKMRGIFSCEEYAVFATKVVSLGGAGLTTQVDVTQMKGCLTSSGRACNALVFISVWQGVQALRTNGTTTYKNHDWTIKVDADAVFFPARMKSMLVQRNLKANQALWVQNLGCWPSIQFVGPLEVVSREGLTIYFEKRALCADKVSVYHVGEDLWMQKCFEALKIPKLDMSGILATGDDPCSMRRCWQDKKVAYHHFKTPVSWTQCYEQSTGERWVLL